MSGRAHRVPLDDALLEPGDDGVVHAGGLFTRQLHPARLPPHILAAPTVPAARTGLIRQGWCHVLIDLKVEAVVEDHHGAAVAAGALVVGGREDCVGVAAVVLDEARRLAAACKRSAAVVTHSCWAQRGS